MSNATILVVDDEPQIRRVLQAALSSNGYDVITTVLREHPDLILLDVNKICRVGKLVQAAYSLVPRARASENWPADSVLPRTR